MSLSLNAESYEVKVVEPLPLVQPEVKKSPAVAFFLSLVLSGAGHLYMDKPGIGSALFLLWVLCIPLMMSGIDL